MDGCDDLYTYKWLNGEFYVVYILPQLKKKRHILGSQSFLVLNLNWKYLVSTYDAFYLIFGGSPICSIEWLTQSQKAQLAEP